MRRVAAVAAIVVLVAASAARARAQASACAGRVATISADTISFSLDAPAGWVIDCDAGKTEGLLVVLYRKGESWTKGDAVMYVNNLTAQDARTTFAARIAAEVKTWRSAAPDAVVTTGADIPLKPGKSASTRRFESAKQGLFEAAAYIPRGPNIPLLVLNAHSRAALEKALPDFEALVRSYNPAPPATQR